MAVPPAAPFPEAFGPEPCDPAGPLPPLRTAPPAPPVLLAAPPPPVVALTAPVPLGAPTPPPPPPPAACLSLSDPPPPPPKPWPLAATRSGAVRLGVRHGARGGAGVTVAAVAAVPGASRAPPPPPPPAMASNVAQGEDGDPKTHTGARSTSGATARLVGDGALLTAVPAVRVPGTSGPARDRASARVGATATATAADEGGDALTGRHGERPGHLSAGPAGRRVGLVPDTRAAPPATAAAAAQGDAGAPHRRSSAPASCVPLAAGQTRRVCLPL